MGGRLHARSGRERDADLSRLAEFQTPTILDRNFNFHRSISYSDLKIVKIIVCILYICKDVYTSLNYAILICGGVYMVISFQSYEISIYIKKRVGFETQLMETTNYSRTVSKIDSHNIQRSR